MDIDPKAFTAPPLRTLQRMALCINVRRLQGESFINNIKIRVIIFYSKYRNYKNMLYRQKKRNILKD